MSESFAQELRTQLAEARARWDRALADGDEEAAEHHAERVAQLRWLAAEYRVAEED
ncbi:hypothetical protein [Streptomyces tateyamensis]|uniref:hypothetical protein n=1 Tax=Streptomyces tateyamensis TaxID=565073 RepID=UPI0015E8A302|nr:hypothetical protein [Streptomyces tateyamensis]